MCGHRLHGQFDALTSVWDDGDLDAQILDKYLESLKPSFPTDVLVIPSYFLTMRMADVPTFKLSPPSSYKLILLPKVANNHWTLFIFYPKTFLLSHYDSLRSISPPKRRQRLSSSGRAVKARLKAYYSAHGEAFQEARFEWQSVTGATQASGTRDCGLYVIQAVQSLARGQELEFDPQPDKLREEIVDYIRTSGGSL